MPPRKNHSQPKPVPVGREEFGLFKLGLRRYDLTDPYHLAVSLPWTGFAAALIGCWLALNLVFALLYWLGPGAVANARPGAFSDVFFFSIETLATVGYGVMSPATLYGHIVSATEIVTGMAFTAISTGLLFVRFSRPRARFIYAEDAVITSHNCAPTLMVRFANGRLSILNNADVRLYILLPEHTAEGKVYRRVYDLKLVQRHLPVFVLPWTVMHEVDRSSPLAGHDAASLIDAGARLILTVEAHDVSLGAPVRDMKDYAATHIRFGIHYADAVSQDGNGRTTADLSRVGLLEPDNS